MKYFFSFTARVFLFLFISLVVGSVAVQAGDSMGSTRHFEGQRYLVLGPKKVHEKPNENARIIYDLDKWRMIYLTPTADSRWFAINGTGLGKYPESYIGMHANRSEVDLVNGKLNISTDRIDSDDYKPLSGYINIENISPLEPQSQDFPIKSSDLKRIPSLWYDLGVEERRFIPRDLDQAPFSAVVALSIKQSGSYAQGGYTDFCSGFFLERGDLVATAGHCRINERLLKTDSLVVSIYRATSVERIPIAQVLGSEFEEDKNSSFGATKDWRLVQLVRRPQSKISVLRLPTQGSWLNQGLLRTMTLGFGGDLSYVKPRIFGYQSVHANLCDIPLTATEYERKITEKSNYYFFQTKVFESSCYTYFGDSGGPLVFWNPSSQQYEVLGIFSGGNIARDLTEYMTDKANQSLLDKKTDLDSRFGNYDFKKDGTDYPHFHAIAPISRQVSMNRLTYQSRDHWLLNAELLDLVFQVLGKNISGKEYLEQFNKDIGGIFSDFLDKQNRSSQLTADKFIFDSDRSSKLSKSFFLQNQKVEVLSNKYRLSYGKGDVLDLSLLQRSKIPYEIYYYGGSYASAFYKGNYHIIHENYLQKVKANYFSYLDQDPIKEKDFFEENISQLKLVVVGGDLFILDRNSSRIVAVIRSFTNYFEGNLADLRNNINYSRWAEAPQETEKLKDTGVAQPTELRQSDFGDITPISLDGVTTVTTGDVWRQIVFSLSGKGPKMNVLSAIDNSITVATAIDFSYASERGSLTDEKQTRLQKDLQKLGIKKNDPVVSFCHHENCWLSVNLILRLKKLGYTNILWMRNGYDEWMKYRLPVSALKPSPSSKN
jgi:rhodanese-related sulfurtransferase/V8-like Glu-specific endopeptidase